MVEQCMRPYCAFPKVLLRTGRILQMLSLGLRGVFSRRYRQAGIFDKHSTETITKADNGKIESAKVAK